MHISCGSGGGGRQISNGIGDVFFKGEIVLFAQFVVEGDDLDMEMRLTCSRLKTAIIESEESNRDLQSGAITNNGMIHSIKTIENGDEIGFPKMISLGPKFIGNEEHVVIESIEFVENERMRSTRDLIGDEKISVVGSEWIECPKPLLLLLLLLFCIAIVIVRVVWVVRVVVSI